MLYMKAYNEGKDFLVCIYKILESNCLFCLVSLHGTTQIPWKDFLKIWYLSIFQKSVETIKSLLKSVKNNRHFTRRPIFEHLV